MGYRGRVFQRERSVRSGDRLELSIYPVFQQPGKRRKKCKPCSEIQRLLNQKNKEKQFQRLLNENFKDGEDIYLSLSYAKEPENRQEAARIIRNYLRRVKRAWEKTGQKGEFRYLYTISIGSESGRVHHHLVVTGGLTRETMEDLWGMGYANSRRLMLHQDRGQGLSRYICRQKKDVYRSWSGSRNLRRPEPQIRDGAITKAEKDELVKAVEMGRAHLWMQEKYPGWIVTEATVEFNDVNHGAYVYIEARRE